MKRIITLILALIMCVGTFSTLGIFAEGEGESAAVEYIHKENFNNMTLAPSQKEAMGLKAFNTYAVGTVVEDGVWKTVNSDDGGHGHVDFQIWAAGKDYVAISEEFTLYMEIKPEGPTWNRDEPNFIGFMLYSSSGVQSTNHMYVATKDGAMVFHTDNGQVVTSVLPTDSFTTVELAFSMTDGLYSKVEFYINGEKMGEKTLNDELLTAINRFRMFETYNPKQGISMNAFAFVKGAQSIYGTEIPDNPPQVVVTVPKLPTVDDADKSEVKYFFHEDFNGVESINTSDRGADIIAANGFWLNNDNSDETYALEDGVLRFDGAQFLDLQMHTLQKYKVKEDFVLSVNFKPLQSGISGHIMSDVRRDSQGESAGHIVQIVDGHLMAEDGTKDLGILPVNEWTLIEFAFDFDDDAKEFLSWKLLLNGEVVYEADFENTDALIYTQIKFFRMFRYMRSYDFAIDDVNIISGLDSIIYALPYGETAPEQTPDAGESTGDENASDDSASGTSKLPSKGANTEAATTEAAATEEKKGCGSFVSGGAVALVTVFGLGASAVVRKKRH